MRHFAPRTLLSLLLVSCLSAGAFATDSTTTTTGTTSGTTTTTTGTTTGTTTTTTPPETSLTPPPVTHKPKPVPPKPAKKTEFSVTTSKNCAGGGSRSNDGTYDVSTGAVNFVTTLTACGDSDSTTHDGTITITGSALAGSISGTYALDLTYVFDTHYVNPNADVQRQCTWHKVGTFDTNTEKFTGTITKSDCVLTLTETAKGNILENILRKATVTE